VIRSKSANLQPTIYNHFLLEVAKLLNFAVHLLTQCSANYLSKAVLHSGEPSEMNNLEHAGASSSLVVFSSAGSNQATPTEITGH
jgi:hypothetical protein